MIHFTIPEINKEEIDLEDIRHSDFHVFTKAKSIRKISEVFNILDSLPKEYNLEIFKIDTFNHSCLMTKTERQERNFCITSRYYQKLIKGLYSMSSIKLTNNSNIFILKEIIGQSIALKEFFENPDETTPNTRKAAILLDKITECLNQNINNNKPLKGEYYFVFIDELIWYLSERFKGSFIEKNCLLSNKEILINKNKDDFNDFILHLYADRNIAQFIRNWMLLYMNSGKDLIEAFLNRVMIPFKGFCFENENGLTDLKIKVQ